MTWPTGDVVFPGLGPNYEFIRLMGQGGSGSVALVRYLPLQRLEAVKTVRAGARQLPAVRRLEREGRVLGRLHHPGIVDVYRILTSNRSVALVMEYLPGGDLQHAIDEGRLSGSERVQVLTQVADALTAAAAAGVVHRDVKPSNVLLDGAGRAVLADFGLARLPRDHSAFRTMAGAVTGTPLFMAPEQIDHPDSEAASVDAYAFGVLAYRLLTGRWPYPTSTVAEIILAHRTLPPASPWDGCPEFPRNAGNGLLAALRKDPSARLMPKALAHQLSLTSNAAWDAVVGAGGAASLGSAIGNREIAEIPIALDVGGAAGATGSGTRGDVATGADPNLGIATGAQTGIGAGTNARSAVTDQAAGSGPASVDVVHHSHPGREKPSAQPMGWVEPQVYRVRRHLRPGTTAVLTGATIGLILAVVILWLMTR